jgi:hypothetical protein
LSQWATEQFGLSASHPAGKYETGKPRKNICTIILLKFFT